MPTLPKDPTRLKDLSFSDFCLSSSQQLQAWEGWDARRSLLISAPSGFRCKRAEGKLQGGHRRGARRQKPQFATSQSLRKEIAPMMGFVPNRSFWPEEERALRPALSHYETPRVSQLGLSLLDRF